MKKYIINYFLFLLFFFSIFASGVIDSHDGFIYAGVARNLYYQGKPAAPPREYATRENIHLGVYPGKDGNYYSNTGIGYSIAMLPAVKMSDIILKLYNVVPAIHFPLENNWPILFFTSFTNIFFTAGVGTLLFLYLEKLGLKKKSALVLSFLSLISTNLFSLSKHVLPHMMFIFFLLLAFYLIRVGFEERKKKYLIFSGLSFGITSLSYNFTFLFALPLLLLYTFLLDKEKLNLRKQLKNILLFTVGFLPFITIYFYDQSVRASDSTSIQTVNTASLYIINNLKSFPFTVFLEGLYGQLFSPGRSIFIYSPLLLIPLIFWSKLDKEIMPEAICSIFLSLIYILMHATLWSADVDGGNIQGLWHGESSWGPRYLSPLIPFGVLLAGYIYEKLSILKRFVIIIPIIIVGIYINFLGVFMPYQIKFHYLEEDFTINQTTYTNHVYSNFLPRFSPIVMMTKKLWNNIKLYPKTLDNGPYDVRFYDGIDFAFDVGQERWRSIEKNGYISFDNKDKSPAKSVSFMLINHSMNPQASSSASLTFTLNNQVISENKVIEVGQTEYINLPFNDIALKQKDNDFKISYKWVNKDSIEEISQLLAIKKMEINGENVNLESIDAPYISGLGRAMGYEYKNWGGENKDLWKTWHIHTQVFERTPDLWWLRPVYYWDIPNTPFVALLILDFILTIYFLRKVVTANRR